MLGSKISAPSLTNKDKKDLAFALEHGADAVGLSFVRQESDIAYIKQEMAKLGKTIPVVAKIETPEAVENLESIVKAAEGLMVARAEVDNIAHAVWQGGTAFMLSGETAVGKHPSHTIKMMKQIAMTAQQSVNDV